jgi:hypothetical protein
MKEFKREDLVIPCIDCGNLPDIEWECDDLTISCKGCMVSIWRGLSSGRKEKPITNIDYFLEQINMWNRAHTLHEEQTTPQDAS